MNHQSSIERVRPLNPVWVIFLLMVIGLLSVVIYSIFFPKTVLFRVEPAGASVYSNGRLLCSNTPCNKSLNRVLPKRITIDRAYHFPYVIELDAFGLGWDESLVKVIRLQPMVVDSDKQSGMTLCREERTKALDPNNVDAEPCYRVPPVMPWRAKRSGHCHLIFDINYTGKTKNIRLNGCSEKVFESHAIQAVEKWTYLPKIEDGKTVERLGVENKITFRLTDERGRIIPQSLYYEENSEHVHRRTR